MSKSKKIDPPTRRNREQRRHPEQHPQGWMAAFGVDYVPPQDRPQMPGEILLSLTVDADEELNLEDLRTFVNMTANEDSNRVVVRCAGKIDGRITHIVLKRR